MTKKEFKPNNVHKIGLVAKTTGGQTRMVINEFDERSMLDIRAFYKKKDMDDFLPTGKGVSVDVNALRRLHKLIGKALQVAEENELIDEDKQREIEQSFKKVKSKTEPKSKHRSKK